MLMDAIAKIIGSLAWPLSVIIIVIIFRDDIHKLLNRLVHAKYPGGEAYFKYGNVDIDEKPGNISEVEKVHVDGITENQPVCGGGNWSNIANVYWLGHDIMFAIDIILRGAPRNNIIKALRQTLHHATSIDIKHEFVIVRLEKLYREAENSLETDWNNTKRKIFVSELAEIREVIGSIVKKKQPNFEPWPTS